MCKTLALAVTTLFACNPIPDARTGTSSSALVAYKGPSWTSPRIPVCFENPNDGPYWAQVIQDTVEQIWDRGSALELTGWGTCQSGDPGIHVLLSTDTWIAGYGATVDGVTDGVMINTDPCSPQVCTPQFRENLVRVHAIQAFAYALGLVAQYWPPPDPNDPADAAIVTRAPRDCQPGDIVTACTWPTELTSATQDLRFARYGGNQGSLYAGGGRCLASGGRGETIAYPACDDVREQSWPHQQPWAPPRYHTQLQADDGTCARPLVIAQKGERVITFDCANDLWTMNATGGYEDAVLGKLRGLDGCCLMQQPEEFPAQCFNCGDWQSDVVLDGPSWLGFSILSGDRTRCLEPDAAAAGSQVHWHACSMYDSWSKWVWDGGGLLRHFLSGMCLFNDPVRLRIEPCDDQLAERWRLSSSLALDGSGLCLSDDHLDPCAPDTPTFTFTP